MITVNGTSTSLRPLVELTGNRRGIAVAVNGAVVPHGLVDGWPLSDGDVVEILTAVQGG